jgi:hypothetical protein
LQYRQFSWGQLTCTAWGIASPPQVGDQLIEHVQQALRGAVDGKVMLELMQDKHRADKCARLAEMVSKLQTVDDTLSRVTL